MRMFIHIYTKDSLHQFTIYSQACLKGIRRHEKMFLYIKTHDSESRGQGEAGCTTLLSYRLVIKDTTRSNYIESVIQQ